MGKQIAGRQKKRATKKVAKDLEPLSKLLSDGAGIADWLECFDALSVREKNRAVRENADVLTELYGSRVRNGDGLIGPLAAENQGNRDEGEHTFLVVLRPLRERLIKEYEIKTAAEFMLLDALVLSYHQYIRASSTLHSYTAYGKSYDYETLVRYAQTYMIRANDTFLRNLEALRQLKAAPFTIKIEQVGQVNFGDKQVNLAAGSTGMPSGQLEETETPSKSASSRQDTPRAVQGRPGRTDEQKKRKREIRA